MRSLRSLPHLADPDVAARHLARDLAAACVRLCLGIDRPDRVFVLALTLGIAWVRTCFPRHDAVSRTGLCCGRDLFDRHHHDQSRHASAGLCDRQQVPAPSSCKRNQRIQPAGIDYHRQIRRASTPRDCPRPVRGICYAVRRLPGTWRTLLAGVQLPPRFGRDSPHHYLAQVTGSSSSCRRAARQLSRPHRQTVCGASSGG